MLNSNNESMYSRMNLQTIKTPCLILDINRVKRNAERIARLTLEHGVRLRPHVKTHKCVEIARLQTAGHSGAITVSTLAEARAFIEHGFSDITYSVPIEPGKFAEAIELSKRCEHFGLITDAREIPEQFNQAAMRAGVRLDLYLKVDCGYHRCGVDPASPESRGIARLIDSCTNLRFAGILTHAGHSYHCRTREELLSVARREREIMIEFAELLRADGIRTQVISIGSTPTVSAADSFKGIDEVRPGNYIFFDVFQATLGSCSFEDCALTVLTAVTHRDRRGRKVVVDAGAVALSKDRGPVEFDPDCGYGCVLDLQGKELGLRAQSLSQEHGILYVEDEALFDRLPVGARVRILTNHSCLTAAQHPHYHVLDGDRITDRWEIHRGW